MLSWKYQYWTWNMIDHQHTGAGSSNRLDRTVWRSFRLLSKGAHQSSTSRSSTVSTLVMLIVLLIRAITATIVILLVHVICHFHTLREHCSATSRGHASRMSTSHFIGRKSSHGAQCHSTNTSFTWRQRVAILIVLDLLLPLALILLLVMWRLNSCTVVIRGVGWSIVGSTRIIWLCIAILWSVWSRIVARLGWCSTIVGSTWVARSFTLTTLTGKTYWSLRIARRKARSTGIGL